MGATGQWIPWQDREEWSQVVESITTAVAGLGGEVEHLREIARQIEDWYAELEDLLDNLGAITCCSCTTICCTMATVWYDLRDLLFPLPGQQPASPTTDNKKCRSHLCASHSPWVLSQSPGTAVYLHLVYLCGPKRRSHAKTTWCRQGDFRYYRQLKTARKELENSFVDAVG